MTSSRERQNAWSTWLPMVAAAVLLSLMGVSATLRPKPADAEPYHAKIRDMAKSIPLRIGDWIGSEQPVPRSAVQLLRPNVLQSIRYQNTATGRTVSLVLVQCKDARDMAGHYPPRCYPANGWTQRHRQAETWHAAGMPIPGRAYEFSYERPDGIQRITVMDFIILPSGKIVRSIKDVYDAAADYSEHFFGAAQVQLVFAGQPTKAIRQKIFAQLVAPDVPLIRAMEAGVATAGKTTQ